MQRGRPRTNNESLTLIPNIDFDQNCDEIFQLLARHCNYKLRIENRKNKDIEFKYDRKTKEIEELLLSDNLDQNHIFFLRNEKLDLKIINGRIIDTTLYTTISETEFTERLRPLLEKLNQYLFKYLNDDMISNIKVLLKFFEETLGPEREEVNEESKIGFIMKNIRANSDSLKYLLSWERLKQLTENERYEQQVNRLTILKKKISKLRSVNVKRKHDNFLKQREEEIQKEQDKGCLYYLIENLVRKFEDIMSESLVTFD